MELKIEAEQALLGAILCDPADLWGTLDMVQPGDMVRPWHGQVLAAMQRLHSQGLQPSAPEVYRELQEDPDLAQSVAQDAVPLASLMEASPRPGNAGFYAAMVIENAVREHLRSAGSRMAQSAETGDVTAALDQTARCRDDLDTCLTRWTAQQPWMRSEPASLYGRSYNAQRTPPGRAVKAPAARRIARAISHNGALGVGPSRQTAQRQASNVARPPAETDRPVGHQGGESRQESPGRAASADAAASRWRPSSATEARSAAATAIRDLIDDPAQLAVVSPWLRPEHLVPSVHARIYELLLDMDASGRPIDPMTVAWAASRRRLRTDPRQLSGGMGAFAVANAAEVHRLATVEQVYLTGTAIQADCADQTLAPGRLLLSVRDRLQAIERDHQRSCLALPGTIAASRPSALSPGQEPEPEATS